MPRLIPLLFAATLAPQALAGPAEDLVGAARAQIGVTLSYDPAYQRIAYPNGDVPRERGVCTDVVIRAYRAIGIDLQQRVHEQLRAAGKATDRNIDHRRVPNQAAFFRRHGTSLPPSAKPGDYRPGDVVTWRLQGGLNHIGIVADQVSPAGTPLVIHNIGSGAKLEDVLFAYPVTGHYRYLPAAR
ncbi:DUF1287 domain-containing protein [Pseudoduganella sp. SL102]|uniref:DUF1287 domain-containing protein n=1 Tax=Pseudoduganella sp. SL102 TaxID=2995154 RepID=UPI00248A9DE2|nr:DUF1287 domain-containing protein [Pseudoduganella sp. SL102]WBS02102.1 DUF1287 domain-containing protein [Pseudoduganella sp. SL102]